MGGALKRESFIANDGAEEKMPSEGHEGKKGKKTGTILRTRVGVYEL